MTSKFIAKCFVDGIFAKSRKRKRAERRSKGSDKEGLRRRGVFRPLALRNHQLCLLDLLIMMLWVELYLKFEFLQTLPHLDNILEHIPNGLRLHVGLGQRKYKTSSSPPILHYVLERIVHFVSRDFGVGF